MLTLFKDSLRPWYHFFTNATYREYSRIFSKYASATRYERCDIRFLGYSITVPDAVSFAYQFKEIFLEESYKFEARRPNPVIYDCGANIGLSCIYFKKLYPQSVIKAFEADPEVFKLLQSNIEKNTEPGSIQLINAAIWTNNDGVEFNREGSDGGTVVGKSTSGKVRVNSVRLRDLLKSEQIDFLKMDIEGAETDVLLDCNGHFDRVDKIFFEYHSFPDRPQQLNELLAVMSRNGFRYFIQSVSHQNAPFTRNLVNQSMDLQLNIYCYRP